MNPLGLSSFSFEHYTNHWALGCPRPPTRSMQISYQKLPPHRTDERPDASQSISVSHERPKRSLERAYGGSRCGCLEVSFERVDENALDSVVAQVSRFSRKKKKEISQNFHSQFVESENVLTAI